MAEGCRFCALPEDRIIKKLRFWTIELADNQVLLGRCRIIHNGHIEDPIDTTDEERKELWEAMDIVHDALLEILRPDAFNYAFIGAKDRHVHMHVFPRYAVPTMWSGQRFEDHTWGGAPWTNERRELTKEQMLKLRDEIAAAMH